MTYSSIAGVDPNDQSSFIYVYNNNTSIYRGQTTMIRMNITTSEANKTFNFQFVANSSFSIDQIEFQNLFVSNIGDNFPCTSLSNQNNFLYTNGYLNINIYY